MVKARIRQGWLWTRRNPVTLVLVVAALFGYGILLDTRNEVAVIFERSACTLAPASRECQQVKRQSDRARTVRDTCIAFHRVGYRCPVGHPTRR